MTVCSLCEQNYSPRRFDTVAPAPCDHCVIVLAAEGAELRRTQTGGIEERLIVSAPLQETGIAT